jgi:hypothetical protein
MEWTLKNKPSIFLQKKMNEYVDVELIEGFIQDKMGINYGGIERYERIPYTTELDHIIKYKQLYNKHTKSHIISYRIPKHKWGRILPNNHLSLCVLHRPTRHSLCEEYIDLDIENCHPSVLLNYCKYHKYENPALDSYVQNPKQYRASIMEMYPVNEDVAKKLFISLMYGGSYNGWLKENNLPTENKSKFVCELENEIKPLIEIVYSNNQQIKKDVLRVDKNNWASEHEAKCGVMGLWAQTNERIIQETAIQSLGFNLEDIVPCQDGFMILKKLFYPNICEDINRVVKEKLGFDIKWVIKPFDKAFPIRRVKLHKDTLLEAKLAKEQQKANEILQLEQTNQALYDAETEKFEKLHCKILNKSVYVKDEHGEFTIFSDHSLHSAYKHIQVGVSRMDIPISFINKWTNCNNNIRYKNDMGVFPKDCPDTAYNMWRPFPFENIPSPFVDFSIFQKHLLILCNNDNEVYCYMEKWLAQMIQYPEVKTICPTLISKQGAGKGSWLSIIRRLLGNKKVMETSEPERDVWGQFNGQMVSSFLVNLNELSKKSTIDSVGIIKQLITDPSMTINNKGMNQFEITSYHRFLITTNSEDPIQTSDDDRRNLIIRSSDELIKNKPYFDLLRDATENDDMICSYFHYLKSIPDMDKFNNLDIPQTEYQNDLKELYVPIVNKWIVDYQTNPDNELTITASEAYTRFKEWLNTNAPKYDVMNISSFGLKVKNSGLKVAKKHTSKGAVYTFNP